MTNNIIFTRESAQITISTIRVEEIWTNSLPISLTPSNPSAAWAVGPIPTLIVDLQVITKRFNIDGYIEKDVGTSDKDSDGNTITSAVSKKDTLKYIFEKGGVVKMVYEGKTYENNGTYPGIIMDKLTITENPGDEESANSSLLYIIKITSVVGNNYGS